MSDTVKSTVEALVEEINAYYPQSPQFIEAACWADDLKSSASPQEAVRRKDRGEIREVERGPAECVNSF